MLKKTFVISLILFIFSVVSTYATETCHIKKGTEVFYITTISTIASAPLFEDVNVIILNKIGERDIIYLNKVTGKDFTGAMNLGTEKIKLVCSVHMFHEYSNPIITVLAKDLICENK